MDTIVEIKKGSSHAKFLAAAKEQEWDVETVAKGSYAYEVTAIDPNIEPTETRGSVAVGIMVEFSAFDGNFQVGYGLVETLIGGETNSRKRIINRFKEALSCLEHGPKYRAEYVAKQAVSVSLEDLRRNKARALLDAATETQEIERLKERFASDLLGTTQDLKSALQGIQAKVEEALAAVEAGVMAPNFVGLFNGQIVVKAEEANAKRNLLLQYQGQIEHLFGALPDRKGF